MQTFDRFTGQKQRQTMMFAVLLSFLAHLATGGSLSLIPVTPPQKNFVKVKMRVAEVEKPVVDEAPPPPPPLPKKPKLKKETPAPNQQAKSNTPATEVPIQGLTKDSLSPTGTMAAPIGNTLMTEDTGKRLKEVAPIQGDLSAPAKLIASTMKAPPYTDEALDAGLEGSFIVDVYVNLDGSVREAELRKKIGYGMDKRVIDAVRASQFVPRKNKLGVAEDGWTELKVTLILP